MAAKGSDIVLFPDSQRIDLQLNVGDHNGTVKWHIYISAQPDGK